MYISFFSKKEGNNLGRVCVMSFFLLSGRIFLQSTGRFCCIKEFVVVFSVVFIFGFVFSSPLDLVFSSICLLSAALSRLSQALSSWACVWFLLSLVCSSQDLLLSVRAKVTWGRPGSPAALKGARLQTQGARWSRKYYVLCQKESNTCMNTFTST